MSGQEDGLFNGIFVDPGVCLQFERLDRRRPKTSGLRLNSVYTIGSSLTMIALAQGGEERKRKAVLAAGVFFIVIVLSSILIMIIGELHLVSESLFNAQMLAKIVIFNVIILIYLNRFQPPARICPRPIPWGKRWRRNFYGYIPFPRENKRSSSSSVGENQTLKSADTWTSHCPPYRGISTASFKKPALKIVFNS